MTRQMRILLGLTLCCVVALPLHAQVIIRGGSAGAGAAPVGGAVPGTGVLSLGSTTTTAPTYTTATVNPISLTTTGLLRVADTVVDSTAATAVSTACATLADCAATAIASIDAAGMTGVSMSIPAASTLAATLVADYSLDGGTTWKAGLFVDGGTGELLASQAVVTSTAYMLGIQPVNGASHYRARASAVTSGTGTITMRASMQVNPSNGVAQGVALGSNAQVMAGGSVSAAAPTYAAGTINPLSTQTDGSLRVAVTAGGGQPLTTNDSAAYTTGSTSLPAVAKTAPTAVTATYAEALQVRAADGRLFTTNDATVAQATALGSTPQSLVGGSVTTTAPSYTTGQINPLSLQTDGSLRIAGAITGSVTASVGNIVTTIGTVANDTSAIANGLEVQPAVSRATPTATTAGRSEKLQVSATNGAVFTSLVGGANALPAQVVADNTVALSNGLASLPAVAAATPTARTATYATALQVGSAAPTAGRLFVSSGSESAQGAAIASQMGSMAQGSVTTAAPTYTTATINPLSLTTAGSLRTADTSTDSDATAATAVSTACATLAGCAATAVASISAAGQAGVSMSIPVASTLAATLVADYSLDGGTTWKAGFFQDDSTGVISSSQAVVTSTAYMLGIMSAQGASDYRVRISALTSGSTTITMRASMQYASMAKTYAAVTTGAPVYTTGTTNPLSMDVNGAVRVVGVAAHNAATAATAAETLPAIGRSAITASTAGRATALATDSTNGSLNVRLTDSATYLAPNVLAVDATAATNGLVVLGSRGIAAPTAITTTYASQLQQRAADGRLFTTNDATVAQATALGTTPQTLVGGSVTTNAPTDATGQINPLSLTTGGALRTALMPSATATYSTSLASTVAAAATDVWTITGSASKTVKVLSITASGNQTASGVTSFLLVKRSTANTGGTSAAATATPHDSSNAAATATVLAYSANPAALGTQVGFIDAQSIFVSDVVSAGDIYAWPRGVPAIMQPVVLRGTGDVLAINLAVATLAGGSFAYTVTWTEE